MATDLTVPTPSRPALSPDRVAGGAGVLAALLLVAAVVVLPVDDGGSAPADIAERYAGGATGYLRAATLELLSLALTAVLVAGLCAAAVRVGRYAAAAGVVIGGAVLVLGQGAGYAAIATLAHGTAADAGTDVTVALYDLSALLFVVADAGLALLAAAVAVALAGAHRVMVWSSVLLATAAAGAVLGLATEGFWSPHGDFGFLVVVLQLLWTLSAGVALLRRPVPWAASSMS